MLVMVILLILCLVQIILTPSSSHMKALMNESVYSEKSDRDRRSEITDKHKGYLVFGEEQEL